MLQKVFRFAHAQSIVMRGLCIVKEAGKLETRKGETRMNDQNQKPKEGEPAHVNSGLGFGVSFGFLVSGFGFLV